MKIIKLWEFPVPSTNIWKGVHLFYPGADVYLLFDYVVDVAGNSEIKNSGIVFEGVMSHKHTSEKFLTSLMNSYDTLVEIVDSDWVKQFYKINFKIAAYWNLKHYAIFLDSNGLYEFLARGYEVLETNDGEMSRLNVPLNLNNR